MNKIEMDKNISSGNLKFKAKSEKLRISCQSYASHLEMWSFWAFQLKWIINMEIENSRLF